MPSITSNQHDQYLVRHQDQIQGPFSIDFIEAMVMSGVYPPSVTVESVKTSERLAFSNLVTVTKPKVGSVPRKKTKPNIVIVSIAGVISVLIIIRILNTDTSSNPPTTSRFVTNTDLNNTSSTKSQTVTGRFPADEKSYYSPSPPSTKYTPSPQSLPAVSSLGSQKPPDDSKIYRDASGRTYRIPNSDYNRLSGLQTSLSLKQSSLNVEKARLESLSTEVDRDRITVNSYSQYSVDSFNRKVNQVNTISTRVQSLIDDYNRDVNAFNRELERVGTLTH